MGELILYPQEYGQMMTTQAIKLILLLNLGVQIGFKVAVANVVHLLNEGLAS